MVGQEHVVRTLSNAIEQERVHHAYLFVGSRGTGKTSMAKILAASMNCSNGGPTITPCGECESCVSIATANSLDVVEMDAASNNSVDDIRDLRERVAYAPVGGRYKVYILDEAHMLTPAAWNAFLKTLEEPPPHTIFVLATTEANKVLPTVVDRCHRFDFGRPSVPQLAHVLRRAADAESITIPDEAVALVARSATGSFRDALGTLEQLLAYSGPTIALEDVLAVLGAADADLIFGAVDAVAAGDARSALLAAASLAESGRDLGRFFGDLEAHARALMVVQVLGDVPPELRVTAEQDARLAEQAARVGQAEVVRIIELIAAALRALKDGADARTQLELALVKAATPDLEPSVKALQARIARLESRPAPPAPRTPDRPQTAAGRATSPSSEASPARAATPSPPAGDHGAPTSGVRPSADGAAPAAVDRPAAPAYGSSPSADRPAAPAYGSTPADDRPAAPAYGSPPMDDAHGSPADAEGPLRGRTAVAITAHLEGQPPVAVHATLPGAGNVAPEEAQHIADDAAAAVARELATEADPSPAVSAVALVEPDAPTPAPSLGVSVDIGEHWQAVVDSVRDGTPMLAAALDNASPVLEGEDALTLVWPEESGFLKRKAEAPTNKDLLVQAIRAVTGSSLRLAYELRAAGAPAAEAAVITAIAAAPALSDEDLVQRFMDEFDAEELPPEPEEQT